MVLLQGSKPVTQHFIIFVTHPQIPIMKTVFHENQEFIEAVIKQCDICFIGLTGLDLMPYVLPMNFGYRNQTIYLHSAPEGRSIRTLEQNNNICITFSTDHELVFQHEEVACSYRMKSKSVIVWGKVEFVDDLDEKREVLDIIMKQYTDAHFQYNDPAVRNVKIWKVPIEQVTCKEFGAPHDAYRNKTNPHK